MDQQEGKPEDQSGQIPPSAPAPPPPPAQTPASPPPSAAYPPYPAQPYGQPYQYGSSYPAYPYQPYPPARGMNGLALGAFIAAIVGALMCLPLGVVGAIMGHFARRQIKETGQEGDGFARAGIIIGWASLAIFVIFLAIVIGFGVIGGLSYTVD